MEPSLLFLVIPGGWEWIVIILAILLLFGGRKIPELMKGLGQGMREFKKARNEAAEDKRNSVEGEVNSEKEKS
ncbi:MAG: twin-arginine translocase TatA/TatE family subunit [Anaerophaga sp.]|uniref:twin-arginine translocase TatA/TatE family subunit n=1 Tax=Anaerophaga thermohalophila TaxID=177400 RepID=UPI000237C49F|nr:twin-arginine translocase TatA/TatE family subunit [Anaerophaga thermohalophila]MBZ4676370.1 twin-arginine translocase TatA/TatE family subunit [Anaerophaga sp.]MDI3520980.1 sec-independent protein translocase protein TatA [Anaerophaga sp.]MDK2840510.1 sec-independent protein translocase protein TatA [Anaerophaga sp.]MDN5290111.1 sec-independent protein translocase protein TatA [Anaerophaga sp.]